MGDNIEADVWEGENEVVLKDYSDDEPDNEASLDEINAFPNPQPDENSQSSKKAKKKQKFLRMREKKLAKQVSGNVTTSSAISSENTTAEKQYESLVSDLGADSVLLQHVSSSDFFSPYQRDMIKRPCPFVRGIAAGLPGYKTVLEENANLDDNCGSPVVLVLTSGARRAADIINSMSKLLQVKVAKLFAKHFKVSEQVDLLTRQSFPVAVGTPNRMSKLCEFGALRLHQVRILLIDMHQDVKKFTILTMPDVKADFITFMETNILPEKKHLKIALVVP